MLKLAEFGGGGGVEKLKVATKRCLGRPSVLVSEKSDCLAKQESVALRPS